MKSLRPPASLVDTFILKLRYGNYKDTIPSFSLLPYKNIAWLLKVTEGRVKRVCECHKKDVAERQKSFLGYFSRKS